MLTYLLYFFIAGVAATIFKYVFGFLLGLPSLGIMALLKYDTESHPKLFVTIGILNHAVIAMVYSFVIFITTFNYADRYGGDMWFYIIASVLWALTLSADINNFYIISLVTCVGGLILAWLGFSYLGPIILGIISIIIGLVYHLGRVNLMINIAKSEEE